MEISGIPVPLIANFLLSLGGMFLTGQLIPSLSPMFLKANLFGIDMSKTSKDKKMLVLSLRFLNLLAIRLPWFYIGYFVVLYVVYLERTNSSDLLSHDFYKFSV